jgi:hypothetical protein
MPQRVLDRGEMAEDNIIVFTKPILGTGHREHLTLGSVHRNSDHVAEVHQREGENRICLRLTSGAVDSIERNVKNYEEFLRRRSHNVGGRFNPWIAVDQYVLFILRVVSVIEKLVSISNCCFNERVQCRSIMLPRINY